ncbi:unnamed protein product [Calypogeia fissa]
MDSAGAFVVSTGAPNVDSMSQEELERIKAFKRPDVLLTPSETSSTYKINQFAKTATAEGYRWVQTVPGLLDIYRTHDYLDDPTLFRNLEKSTSLFMELNLIMMWSFPDDEQFYKNCVKFLDEGEGVDRAHALHCLQMKLDEATLRPGTLYDSSSPAVHPLCKAFRDLWAQVYQTMLADSLRRWVLLVQDLLLGNAREVRARKYNTIPSVDEYIASRKDTIATNVCMALVDFANKVQIPNEIFYCPEMQRFRNALADVALCINDLWSFKKEALFGDIHNLVILLSKKQDCSYAEAGKQVGKMILHAVAEMEEAISDLTKVTPPEYQHALSRWFVAARNLARGCNQWHANSGRYTE